MEPNTQQPIVSPVPNKNKKMLIVVAIIILVILAAVLIKSKVTAPVDVNSTDNSSQGDNKTLSSDIDNATTFDNEADLKEVDAAFQ